MRRTLAILPILSVLGACGVDSNDPELNSTSITAGSDSDDGDTDQDTTTDGGPGDDSDGGGTSGGATTGGDPSTGGDDPSGGTTGVTGGDPTGGSTTGGNTGGQGGPCGCGFPEWACETDFEDPVGTEGPMPPLCGGGSGLGDGPPNECHGGNFGSYSDADSFCAYFINRFRYLENECGNFNTVSLTLDGSLGSAAQAEAEAVADGKDPTGQVTCGGSPCGPLDGPMFNMNSGASWLYIDGWTQSGHISKNSTFTAAESDMIIQSNPLWADQMGNPIYERHCQFTTEFSNAIVYHYCDWDGMGEYGNPATQPKRVGCGVAVDTDGITWRVVKLGD